MHQTRYAHKLERTAHVALEHRALWRHGAREHRAPCKDCEYYFASKALMNSLRAGGRVHREVFGFDAGKGSAQDVWDNYLSPLLVRWETLL